MVTASMPYGCAIMMNIATAQACGVIPTKTRCLSDSAISLSLSVRKDGLLTPSVFVYFPRHWLVSTERCLLVFAWHGRDLDADPPVAQTFHSTLRLIIFTPTRIFSPYNYLEHAHWHALFDESYSPCSRCIDCFICSVRPDSVRKCTC